MSLFALGAVSYHIFILFLSFRQATTLCVRQVIAISYIYLVRLVLVMEIWIYIKTNSCNFNYLLKNNIFADYLLCLLFVNCKLLINFLIII